MSRNAVDWNINLEELILLLHLFADKLGRKRPQPWRRLRAQMLVLLLELLSLTALGFWVSLLGGAFLHPNLNPSSAFWSSGMQLYCLTVNTLQFLHLFISLLQRLCLEEEMEFWRMCSEPCRFRNCPHSCIIYQNCAARVVSLSMCTLLHPVPTDLNIA